MDNCSSFCQSYISGHYKHLSLIEQELIVEMVTEAERPWKWRLENCEKWRDCAIFIFAECRVTCKIDINFWDIADTLIVLAKQPSNSWMKIKSTEIGIQKIFAGKWKVSHSDNRLSWSYYVSVYVVFFFNNHLKIKGGYSLSYLGFSEI